MTSPAEYRIQHALQATKASNNAENAVIYLLWNISRDIQDLAITNDPFKTRQLADALHAHAPALARATMARGTKK